MKKTLYHIFTLLLVVSIASCSKDENLEVDMSSYNYDDFQKQEIDDYLYTNLTKPYNIEVVYRFDRSHTDPSKNISPPRIEMVQPAADMILDGFIRVYEKVAGAVFTKTYPPKQFVLFGSHAYNTNGTVTLGTADGGRRVVLYDINNINPQNPDDIKRRLRTIHHEFTHIINQTVAIPPSFRIITTDYVSDWVGTANTEAEALRLGFISRYARSSFGEDFAETVAHLLIEGQAYYNRRIAASTPEGAQKLRVKQQVVEDYYSQFFNINFKELQYEIFNMLANSYNDQSQTLLGAMRRNELASIAVDWDNGAHYTLYGKSEGFTAVWEQTKAVMPTISNNAGRQAASFILAFTSPTTLQLQTNYKNAAGGNLLAHYDFNIAYSDEGNITFTYVDNGTDSTPYNNGRIVMAGWKPLFDYLQNNAFKPNWLAPSVVGLSNIMKFAGLSVVGQEANTFYGPVVFK